MAAAQEDVIARPDAVAMGVFRRMIMSVVVAMRMVVSMVMRMPMVVRIECVVVRHGHSLARAWEKP
jgi:hypothetical protein